MTTWTHYRGLPTLTPGNSYWFVGRYIDADGGQHDWSAPEAMYATKAGIFHGPRRIVYARGLWSPDTGTVPATPPETAWPPNAKSIEAGGEPSP